MHISSCGNWGYTLLLFLPSQIWDIPIVRCWYKIRTYTPSRRVGNSGKFIRPRKGSLWYLKAANVRLWSWALENNPEAWPDDHHSRQKWGTGIERRRWTLIYLTTTLQLIEWNISREWQITITNTHFLCWYQIQVSEREEYSSDISFGASDEAGTMQYLTPRRISSRYGAVTIIR